MINAATALLNAGVLNVYASSTHAVLSGGAPNRFQESSIRELVCTDTIPFSPDKDIPKIKIVSVASLLGEAIHRIHSGMSVGAMFDK